MNLKTLLSPSESILARLNSTLSQIEEFTEEMRALADDELKLKTRYFLRRLELGEDLSELVPEALAVVREAAFRTHNLFAFSTQLLGALVIYEGNFAEMKTGEGKTLVIVLAAYILALEKKGLHVVTVNEYLVKRDAEFCRKTLNFLGLSVGFNSAKLSKYHKREMFKCDVTYTTNAELVFDYLRDNMAKNSNEIVLSSLSYAIIDEGDSVLIDEAGTPLIISRSSTNEPELYFVVDQAVKNLDQLDYKIDWETKTVILNGRGVRKLERLLELESLYSLGNSILINRVHNALQANFILQNGREYIIQDDRIKLIDQWTGRILEGRSYSYGLQQAIQAKEYLTIENESRITAKITYQTFFRKYKKIAALSGTGFSESKELSETYNMIVVQIPTYRPTRRIDLPDMIFKNKELKVKAIISEIKYNYLRGQPLLVGTSSVDESEYIYSLLVKENIPCEILNARNHYKEAEIIARAGQKYAITIATNIAGRGVDIKIAPDVVELGGLYVIACEKNESRRVDDQLRGRSGRQGDPGKSVFFLSLEDTIFKRFGADKFEKLSKKMKEEHFESPFLSRTIASLQKRIQYASFDSRKNLIEYSEILSIQQDIIYNQRKFILFSDNNERVFEALLEKQLKGWVTDYLGKLDPRENRPGELAYLINNYFFEKEVFLETDFKGRKLEDIEKFLKDSFFYFWTLKKLKLENLELNSILKELMITQIDLYWEQHLDDADKTRSTIALQSMEHKSPLNIFIEKMEEIFVDLQKNCRNSIIREVFCVHSRDGALELIDFVKAERKKWEPSESTMLKS
ncbi:DEAD/DEAH box helicase [Candidatus Mycoplasma haematominutum]|uniref:Protein translocase subunit SecA n=1 Tax=Candidatus Mycoplasma haematominutum 'Birmingham 1' TaxID=1116213 RepID=G8C3T5_9MOLU|nr:DEAD/DEAH box helicase [Candidatus Mycoplasma haematominutum]CCE66983.1 protein translocase subunit SecA [Candidatus Mycoplasma haematominutum 'Birmingham 1']